MAAIDYVVRDGVGRLVRGTVGASGANNVIVVDTSSEVSLNLAQGDISDYRRIGNTLEIYLSDGRVLVLEGFFSEVQVTDSRLYLSADNQLVEITFSESWGRTNYAHYDSAAQTTAEGELLFEASSGVVTETETTMAAVPLFLGGGLGGTAVGAAGLAAGAAVIGGGGGGGGGNGGGGGSDPLPNTVTNTGDIIVNMDTADLSLGGGAEPGTVVTVTIGDTVAETTAGDDGTWAITIPAEDLPADGDHQTIIEFTPPGGGDPETITGPNVVVDTDAPAAEFSTGVVSNGDIINAEWHEGGVEISGTGEAGATIRVDINGQGRSALVADDGTWFVSIPESILPEGEYTVPVTLTATDAAGNVTTVTDAIQVDTAAEALEVAPGGIAIDDIINDTENDAGVFVNGTASPGVTVSLTLAGVTVTTQADADGNWTANFGPGALPPGEYGTELVATTIDAGGNVTTARAPVRVDTLGEVSVETATVESDGMVNATEAADGITLTGTTQPGSSVSVDFAGNTYTATVDEAGVWTVDVPASGIPSGESEQAVTATATDAAGNVTTAVGSITIDTEINVALDDTQVGDNMITAQEANAGIVLTGTTQPDATVSVTLHGITRTATVASDGTWTASFTSGDLPSGVMTLDMSVTATDAAGNTATDSGTVELDTLGFVAVGPAPVEGDNVVNGVEAADGVVITGTTQPGSSVMVEFAGASVAAVVAADGTWAASFAAGNVPSGTYLTSATATATSPSGNVATDSLPVRVDTSVDGFAVTSGTVGGDGLLGADELNGGVTVSGTTEPGSTLTLTMAGLTQSVFVQPDGTWSVTLDAGDIPSGQYSTVLTVTSTDAAGNTDTLAQDVDVDTVAGSLSISGAPIEGDDVINEVEAADGVTVTGSADAGAVVTVLLGSVSKTVIAGPDGSWSAYYASTEIPAGTYTANITATTTDAAGNTATASDTVQVDTELSPLAFSAAPVEGDGRITGAEASDGVVVRGIVEPGSTVLVSFGSVTAQALVAADGTWAAEFSASQIPDGSYVATLRAEATDAAGNTDLITSTVQVDTAVENLAITSLPVETGETLNASAAADGITLGGTVEPGSSVSVTLEGVTRQATVGFDGSWTVTYAAGEIPSGEYTADVSVSATDSFGNQATVTADFLLDTEAPGAPLITAFSTGFSGLRSISTLDTDDTIEIAELTTAGAVQELNYSVNEDPGFGELRFNFTAPVSDGSDLVVTAEDAAGNSTSTLFVTESETDPTVDLTNSGLAGFEIEAVDLQYASDADLTLTADMVRSLSDNTDTLTIHGGQDDHVTMTGAVRTGQVQRIGTQDYDVYTLGDGGVSVVIDQDINVVI
ncbi:beta strand repeat-containing protein [Shimia ponticola]|uniref:beta strand repeat-containing protein n=1 Tax=Shimia ponticola TaxID=2582893 RepID=UPI00164C0C50|nr:Ig-like domain-containing protein [Shimia ponticola]